MRTSGMMPYITPRQMATESSTTPKSVMNTIVGGYFCAASAAQTRTGTAASTNIARPHKAPAILVLAAVPVRVWAADAAQKYPPTIVFMTDFGVVDDSVAICRGVKIGRAH